MKQRRREGGICFNINNKYDVYIKLNYQQIFLFVLFPPKNKKKKF